MNVINWQTRIMSKNFQSDANSLSQFLPFKNFQIKYRKEKKTESF